MSTGIDIEDTYELLVHTAGVDEARDLAKALEKDEASYRKLIAAMSAHERAADKDAAALKRIEDQARRTKEALDAAARPGKLSGAARGGAVSRAGLLGANIAQDVIQGGPASAINNILGAANDRGIKALAGEAIAAAGGLKLIAAAFGTVAVAAGAAYLTISEGLRSNKLGWSDLGEVIDKMTGGAIEKTGKVAGETLGSIRSTIGEMVGGIAEATIGWNTAAEAVREHKDEIERATGALADYEKAAKAISGIRSREQDESARRGKLAGQALADLGGDQGIKGTIDKLAEAQAGALADKMEDVEVAILDKDGKATGETKILKKSRKQLAAEAITQDVASAAGGDRAAQEGLRKRLANAGMDTQGLDAAMNSRDPKKVAQDERVRESEEDVADGLAEQDRRDKKKREEQTERMREAEEDAADIAADVDKDQARQRDTASRKAMRGTGLDKRAEDAMLRAALASGGQQGVATAQVAAMISRELQGRGVDAETADKLGREKAEEHAAKLGDEINGRAMEAPEELRKVEHASSADFTRSVESSGADTKLLDVNTQMKDQLTELVKIAKQGPMLGP